MPFRFAATCLVGFILASPTGPARADEGMWTFNEFPAEKVAAPYGFKPDRAWLDHVERASVRLARGCSGSFVSGHGLVMTNHHCAHACIEQLSTAKDDRVASGFYAVRPEDEIRCPDVEINQLTDITDVTAPVTQATGGKAGAELDAALKAITADLAKKCVGGDDHLRCDVVALYHGGQYQLYKYRRYQDVRLVFAPEFSIAFFGGDPDNFEFPRYDFDVSFLRVYEDGKPLRTEDYFAPARTDAAAGDLTFIVGNPGSTDRFLTVDELTYQRDVNLPRTLTYTAELRGVLEEFAAGGGEAGRISSSDLFSVENSFKAIRGRFDALAAPGFMASRQKDEADLKARVAADPALAQTAGPAWDRIADVMAKARLIRDRYGWLEARAGTGSTLFAAARQLVRVADERAKPDAERLKEYTDANFPAIRQTLLSPAPIYPELERLKLTFWLGKLRETFGADDPLVRDLLGKATPAERAAELVGGTALGDRSRRQALLDGGPAALAATNDPMIEFVRRLDPAARAVRKEFETTITTPLERDEGLIARARFKLFGTGIYPDATFTPRLSFGKVAGYTEGDQTIAPFTRFAGLYERATGQPPFALPPTWQSAEARLDPNQAMDFVTTNDIIGGNSGSPVIDRKAHLVGLVFDGNRHSLAGDFVYDPSQNRAVAVTIGALRMGLDRVYHAVRLLDELGHQE